MARMIDMAQEAEKALKVGGVSRVTILPAERQCDMDGKMMTLVTVEDDYVMLRIHKCPECGFEKRYGGGK